MDLKLQSVIDNFTKKYWAWGNSKAADGNCTLATELFYQEIAEAIPEIEQYACCIQLENNHPLPNVYTRTHWSTHCFNVVGDIVIDFTARQFNKTVGFPFIFPREELKDTSTEFHIINKTNNPYLDWEAQKHVTT